MTHITIQIQVDAGVLDKVLTKDQVEEVIGYTNVLCSKLEEIGFVRYDVYDDQGRVIR